MKYSEKFFKIPIRIYDGFSLTKAQVKEEKKFEREDLDSIEGPEEADWVMGYVKLPFKQITSWMDYYSEGRATEDVAKEGFDMVQVFTKDLGAFECTWKRTKFEDELNKFVESTREIKQPAKI